MKRGNGSRASCRGSLCWSSELGAVQRLARGMAGFYVSLFLFLLSLFSFLLNKFTGTQSCPFILSPASFAGGVYCAANGILVP